MMGVEIGEAGCGPQADHDIKAGVRAPGMPGERGQGLCPSP